MFMVNDAQQAVSRPRSLPLSGAWEVNLVEVVERCPVPGIGIRVVGRVAGTANSWPAEVNFDDAANCGVNERAVRSAACRVDTSKEAHSDKR